MSIIFNDDSVHGKRRAFHPGVMLIADVKVMILRMVLEKGT
jgi:hypothetical protein